MSIDSSLYTALGGLVSNRVYPNAFPQTGSPPVWPGIRYAIISVRPTVTVCGDGGYETADTRVQLDVVATTRAEVITLEQQVLTAMQSFPIPAIFENSTSGWDPETKTYRAQIDYVFYASSPATT